MKRLLAMILVCIICITTTAFAAEWAEGLGPNHPMPGVAEVNLDEQMGYCYFYPKASKDGKLGLEAEHFCSVLEIYLPREDIALGEGHAHVYDSTDTEVADIDFANPDQVQLRTQTEAELAAKKWGSGVCIEMYLPVSLKFGESYYVLMDLFCFSGSDGKIPNYDLVDKAQWNPVVTGDYGISGLYYSAPPAPAEPEEGEEGEEAEVQEPEDIEFDVAPTAEPEDEGPFEPKYNPVTGDIIRFDLVLGGDAKTAVVFSENDSVYIEENALTESGPVKLTVTKDELDWGVVFLDANEDVVKVIKPAIAEK